MGIKNSRLSNIKKVFMKLFIVCIMGMFSVCAIANEKDENIKEEIMNTNIMYIKVGDRILTASLVDNSSTRALKKMLAEKPLVITMSDYGNFEKVGSLGKTLPRNDESIITKPGDLILYQGNSFVIYYDINSWNFTRLGKIENISQGELKKILGVGSITVTLSLEK
ncbi:cyclophilin-like fold protein [Treponema phagedenis]|uniref:Cyclophilin-like domain-containing protein n=2 Tax=Treponema phagedenis TaxID=162 RepID=A0A0B7GWU5_TREPH|nr:cyclophilin-like fold protein [Treponema phagedenis]CEM62012.1 conserved exported hypothetical protein [Treponema phagedenis]